MIDSNDKQQPVTPASDTAGPLRTGWMVFIALAILTIVEYVVAITVDANLVAMIVIAVAKAGFILYYFMHIVRAWRAEEE